MQEYQLSKEDLEELNSFNDKQLVVVWKNFFAKAKRVKSSSPDFARCKAIAEEAMRLHNLNLKEQKNIEEN